MYYLVLGTVNINKTEYLQRFVLVLAFVSEQTRYDLKTASAGGYHNGSLDIPDDGL